MKQVLQSRGGLTVVRDVPAPACPSGGVLVRNEYSVISTGTERAAVSQAQKSLAAKARERPDLVRQVAHLAVREGLRSTREAVGRKLAEERPLGYSSAGRVLEVGAAVRGLSPGDLVACAGGGYANHAEVVSIPRNLCATVPDGVPATAAAFTTIASIALHGIRLADSRVGDHVAVIGCGLVGQLSCRLLQAAGAEVFALDVDSRRAEAAKEGGAHHALAVDPSVGEQVLRLTGGIGVDQAIVTAAAPSSEPLILGTEIARDRGAVVLVGAVPIELPRERLFEKELVFRVSRSYGPGRYDSEYEIRGLDYPIGYVRWTEQRNMEGILGLQARGVLQLEDLVEEIVPVDAAERAYSRLTDSTELPPAGAILLSYPAAARDGGPPARAKPTHAAGRDEHGGRPRLGLIGPGVFARRVIVPAFADAGAALEAVAGGAGPSAEAASRELGFQRVLDSDDALIADPAVDVVAICTRHASHAALVCGALDAGKHVFCEKPLALTTDELETVMEAAERADRVVAVGFNRRFSPLMVELRDFVAAAGTPITGAYRISAGQFPPGHWVHDLTDGGGRALGEVCHFVDSLSYVAGEAITEVHAAGHGHTKLPVQSRDNLGVNLSFADGSVASVLYSAQGSPRLPKERLEAFAGSRTAILDDFVTLELYDGDSVRSRKSKRQDKGHLEEVAAFLQAVSGSRQPISLRELENVSLATLAVVESLRTGRPVRVEAAA